MLDFSKVSAAQLREVGSLKWTGKTNPKTGEALMGCWVAEMDFVTAPPVLEALTTAITSGLLGYMPPQLPQNLRTETARLLGERYGWEVEPEAITPVVDVLSILREHITLATSPGEQIVVPTPAYMPFLTIPGQLGRECVQVPSRFIDGQWSLDMVALHEALARPQAKLLILCNPWNPTGRVLSETELQQVSQLALETGVQVFADEIHAPLTMPGFRHIPFASLSPEVAAVTVTAHAASKGWNLAGLHCAQLVISDANLRQAWQEVATRMSHGATPLGVLATTVAYREGREWLEEVREYLSVNLSQGRDLACQLAPKLQAPALQGTYLQAWDCAAYSDNPVAVAEEQAGVAVNGGTILGDAYPTLLRLNAATPRHLYLEMVQRLASALVASPIAPHEPAAHAVKRVRPL
ncbi:MalY/PatB family protein [Mobiluncus mulieris]|uniref:cysteine-S-conjugate beta-lyase n=1 Tax=Mobiluncus mulieris TaxID=2052 RepID=A0A7Y0Y3B3_9ACTO|nr:aminotransferase class I/II-fold pyridoxal phosphate-dependent enzyme [Mobiluncus mulieris]EFN93963.1 aminotransferase, class I/II [Mobiluncus mulieris FB024-16]MBB5845502.1 cystathionine beta-lyase [Mobiluncus mulieris]MCU9997284.1 aminotransferase class I/II-fold pyridoxal phosphate-dependent enzyme [Mobiluncus mulieris]NMW61469.1 aminotransferase class I/II-fold pyridoxal phosphate-dependent enzyme [Mobiluncus mulieris]NMX04116.1 aminotransferase class I/II-fold pyridoxal phosphate-depen